MVAVVYSSRQLNTTQPFAYTPLSGMGKESEKNIKLMGQDKKSLAGQKRKGNIKILRKYTSQEMHNAIAYHQVTYAQPAPV